MRMYCVQPRYMCKSHLIQEHADMHRFASAIEDGEDLSLYIRSHHLEQDYIVQRHDELVKEIEKRGMTHKTPLKLAEQPFAGVVHTRKNQIELHDTCTGCRLMQFAAMTEFAPLT